jgi:hypothetical protein
MPANKLWLPDLNVLNIADGSAGFIPISSSNLAIINNTGLVYVIFSLSSLKTKCGLNAYYYPFDRQNCSILIGSWQHDSTRINFLSEDNFVDLTSYTLNPVWSLNKVEVNKVFSSKRFLNTFGYSSGDIGFYLIIQRGSMYSMINNIFPSIVLNVVILAAYFIPVIAPQVGLSKY